MKKKWWHDKVAYQIYPKSFCDSNGDGVGDIQGIIGKLDYLKDLGVDIVWLSPIYCSPLADQGYDISDYYGIDPQFGTMEDMEELLEKAKQKDMHIVMDLVVNHCSDEHEWFKQAIKDPQGKYGKYFYIREGKEGKVPCNWRSIFGGSMWEKLPESEDLYYLHTFHKKQPDLNWENEEVRTEIYNMMNWWLDKGLAGFRVDAIINIKKPEFIDFKADRADGLVSCDKILENVDGVMELLQEMKRETFEKYDAFSVGEVFHEKKEDLPDFIGDDGCFSSMFDFNETICGQSELGWFANKGITPNEYRDECFKAQARAEGIGFMSNIIENHDEPRGVSHYLPEGECDEDGKKMLATAYFFLKGLPFIYQGQEIGMENVDFTSIDQINDIASLDEYKVALNHGLSESEAFTSMCKYSRDNSRVPFAWNNKAYGGFTTGVAWLIGDEKHQDINLEQQQGDEESVFSYYKQLIRLRKNEAYKETIVYGKTVPIYEDVERVMAYYREGCDNRILIIANFNMVEQKLVLEEEPLKILINNQENLTIQGKEITMKAHQSIVLEMPK